ncbi:MAG: hypothetical protein BRC22_00390 [Parcubacteria group bacterium QH_9_35_7]|nr:MAG: hypothetical protein BRC22_00390 [Parcubacteria group bacterium QH_9_35_7]
MTEGTTEITRIVLEDAQKIMEHDREERNDPILYTKKNVQETMKLAKKVQYNRETEVLDGVTATWKDAGHILGSAFLEVTVGEKTIAFSGDIGNNNVPILKETQELDSIDTLIVESTYGDSIHEARDKSTEIMLNLIKKACKNEGTVMMPAFSIERTQELLYSLHQASDNSESELLKNLSLY